MTASQIDMARPAGGQPPATRAKSRHAKPDLAGLIFLWVPIGPFEPFMAVVL
jgi:hypothetical protein